MDSGAGVVRARFVAIREGRREIRIERIFRKMKEKFDRNAFSPGQRFKQHELQRADLEE